jgi:hypothetical protein
MKQTLQLVLCVTGIFVLYSTCRKFDFPRHHPAEHCRITHILDFHEGDELHRTVLYNEFGDPISVKYREDEFGTGNPDFIFEYDDHRRLVHYTGFSDHRLFYNNKGQVAIDSVFANYAGQEGYFEDIFHYDIYGRIRKVVSTFYASGSGDPNVGSVEIQEYNYNSRGNLVKDFVTYTRKPSIYRTHPVWMFVHRDYSINNQSGPETYNEAGLPVAYGSTFQTFLDKSLALDVVSYECREDKH